MTLEEQETIITWDKTSSKVNVYTADPALIKRLKGLQSYKLVKEYKQEGKVVAYDFEAEKKLITLRSKAPVSHMTDEQKKAASERLREYRQAQNAI